MNMRVMFDSNTWRQVANPEKYPEDARAAVYRVINLAIRSGEMEAFISETTIAIEQVKRKERLDWLKTCTQYSGPVEVPEMPPWVLTYSVGLRPSERIKPVVATVVRDRLIDAARIGMKILRVDRTAYPEASLLAALPDDVSIAVEEPRDEVKMHEMFEAIEHFGRGLANLKRLGLQHTSERVGIHWTDGVASLGSEYVDRVATLFGEWADGDAIAAAYAHGLDAVCTLDNAKGASQSGIESVMSPDFKELVATRLGLSFHAPEDLPIFGTA